MKQMAQTNELELLYTKIFGVLAGSTYTIGSIMSTADDATGLLFKILSCISLVFVIAVNYEKGIEKMKKWVKIFNRKKP